MVRSLFPARAAAVGLAAAALLAAAPGPAAASPGAFAPVDRAGPALTVPKAKLDQALACTANVGKGRQTVLFVPGTTVNPREDYSWNWFRALDKLGRPYCAVTLPFNTTGDTQIASEYVVSAIRTIYARTGQKVQVMGHSQGGTEPRFALRFWPDLRSKVDDYIAFAATNHGSALIRGLCTPSCTPALWQQIDNSNYIQAMNSYQETFAGISYTAIYTHFDQFVQPNLDDTGTTSLSGPGDITNVALQDVCPANTAEHLAIGTYDPVAYALAMDALTHRGPADPSRIPASVCAETFMPGVDPRTFAVNFADASNQIFVSLTTDPRVDAEPVLKSYTRAGA
jgi:triacylglycerol esterase/lipase EstA (alpha/beta hydrolase family)